MKVVKCKKFKNVGSKVIPFLLASSLLGGGWMKSCVPTYSLDVVTSFASDALCVMKEHKKKLEIYSHDGCVYECEYLTENHCLIKKDINENEIYCDGVEEFKKYLEMRNLTYSDIRAVILAKKNIKSEYKEWMLAGLDNLQKELSNADLAVLYYNIKRMEIIEISADEMIEKIGTTGACFAYESATVYVIPNSIDFRALCHEVFVHGMNIASIRDGEKIVSCRSGISLLYFDYYSGDYKKLFVGRSLEEGKAQMLSDLAAGCVLPDCYDIEAEQLRIFFETCGVTIEDYIEYGLPYLVRKMQLNDIDEPIEYILSVDGILKSIIALYREFSFKYR